MYLQILYPPALHSWLLRANWILFVCFLVLSPFSPKPGGEESLTVSRARGDLFLHRSCNGMFLLAFPPFSPRMTLVTFLPSAGMD